MSDRPLPTFAQLGLPPILVHALGRAGISAPFPIQAATIPDILAGRDVLGRGPTGSGKTLAFGLPLLVRLKGGASRPSRPRAVVLAPTRELAAQIEKALDEPALALGLRTATIVGGVPFKAQAVKLSRTVDVVIATPGRLADHVSQGTITLDDVRITTVDEADHMSELGFPAAGHRDPGPHPETAQAAAVLGNPRRRGGHARRALPARPGHARDRGGRRRRRLDGTPRAARAARDQVPHRRPHRGPQGPDVAVRPNQGGRGPPHRRVAGGRDRGGRPARRQAAGPPHPGARRVRQRDPAGAGGDRCRSAGHPRRRRLARRARRPAHRTQGVPAPRGPHRPRRGVGCRGDGGDRGGARSRREGDACRRGGRRPTHRGRPRPPLGGGDRRPRAQRNPGARARDRIRATEEGGPADRRGPGPQRGFRGRGGPRRDGTGRPESGQSRRRRGGS